MSFTKLKQKDNKPLTPKQRKRQLDRNKSTFLRLIYQESLDILDRCFPALRVLYNVALNELRSETIVESICSVIKTIYTSNRKAMSLDTLVEHVMIRLLVPQNHELRDRIVNVCAQIFEILHGDQIVTEWYRKKKTQSNKGIAIH
eukprot:744420_1